MFVAQISSPLRPTILALVELIALAFTKLAEARLTPLVDGEL
jgi:hypothetical protein